MAKILVVGSANADLVTYVDKMPKEGETRLGESFSINAGGKGANQAVACAKAGGNVTLLAKIGQDEYGKMIESTLIENNVNTKLLLDSESQTGVASITVDSQTGENKIVVVKGANDKLTIQDINDNIELIKQSDILIVQLEIPLHVARHAILIGYLAHKTVILNPAPAQKLNNDILKYVTYLTPNKTELEILADMEIHNEKDLKIAIEKVASYGVKSIIVTLGDKGAVLYKRKEMTYIPSYKVDAIDTTGAGDCFNGVFAAYLAKRYNAIESVKYAMKAASICVTREGTIKAMPSKKEIHI
ncbi:MAG: ribokinase [Erysipelotrichales bacterium]|nr:ribokinase [Erysipelotrichales bacterium]